MTTHINAIRTVALLCIAGKALATSYTTVEHGAHVSATIYVCFTNFLLLSLGYFSFEYGIRFFVLPNARQIHAAYSFRKRMTSASEQAIDKQPPEPEPSSPLDSPKVHEIIDYTLGTFANVLTDEWLIMFLISFVVVIAISSLISENNHIKRENALFNRTIEFIHRESASSKSLNVVYP